MVASTHWLASSVGMRMLEAGGNAFDAAVAAGFTLSVVEPHLNGPGGDAPIIGHRADGRAHVRDLRAGHRARRRDHRRLPRPRAWTSSPAPATSPPSCPGRSAPGSTCSRGTAPSRWPTSSRRPSATRATATRWSGPRPGRSRRSRDLFTEHWPTSAAVYLPHGEVPSGGRAVQQPGAGRHVRAPPGRAAARARRRSRLRGTRSTRASSPRPSTRSSRASPCRTRRADAHTGLLRAVDLAGWRATEEPTTSLRFAGRTIHKTAAWGQGPVLLQQLAMLEALGVADLVRTNDTVDARAHRRRGGQARVRRPRGLVRRRGRRPARHPALRRVRGRACAARRRRRLRRTPARLSRRARPPRRRGPVGRLASSPRPASANRPSPRSA